MTKQLMICMHCAETLVFLKDNLVIDCFCVRTGYKEDRKGTAAAEFDKFSEVADTEEY